MTHASERLAAFPESGRIMPEFPTLPYRKILVGNHRVLYRIEGEVVWIAAVVHGRRLLGITD
jgi:plasmid stabilization system protein ParE